MVPNTDHMPWISPRTQEYAYTKGLSKFRHFVPNNSYNIALDSMLGEWGGLVVHHPTPNQEVLGLIPTQTSKQLPHLDMTKKLLTET